MHRHRFPALVAVILAGSAAVVPAFAQGGSPGRPTDLGRIQDDELVEASGLVVSRSYPGMLWSHNDSGDSARIFLLDESGRGVARVNLDRAEARDWEDIAAGPGPVEGTTYLFVADIGDNARRRTNVRIYRLPEPGIPPAALGGAAAEPVEITVEDFDTITLEYPDGARNAETFLVDPASGDFIIVTKGSTHPEVYRAAAPGPGDSRSTLRLTGTLEFETVPLGGESAQGGVGGDVSPDGSYVLVKSYFMMYRWTWDGSKDMPFVGSRTRAPYLPEPQGEAVAIALNGARYFTLSEKVGDRIPRLYRYGDP